MADLGGSGGGVVGRETEGALGNGQRGGGDLPAELQGPT